MAGEPITWRNVSGPSLTDAFRPMQTAQQSILGGLDSFNNVLQKQETVDRANWQQQKENNLNEFMNQIYAAKGPEAFKQMQDSGELGQMLAGYGAQIDQSAARRVMDTRLGDLQKREQATWDYNNAALDQKEAPVVDQVKGLIAQGKLQEAKPLIESLSPRNQAGMFQSLDTRTQEELRRDRDAKRFGWEAEKAPLEIQGIKLGNAAKGQQLQLGGLQIQEAKQNAEDRTATRALENAIAAEAARHSAEREVAGKTQGVLAAKLGLPVDARGMADLSNYSSAQLQTFDQAARVTGVPLSASMLSGDTQRADSFYDNLVKSGKFPARLLRSNETAIRSAFNSPVGERGLVGNDAFNAQLTRAQNQVGFDRQDASNWYAPNSADARRSYDDLATRLPDIVKSMPAGVWFGDNQKDIPALQGMLGEIAATGIRRKDGTYVTPSVNDVLRFIRSEEGGFRDAKRAEDVRKKLEEWVNSSEALDMQKKGLESQKWRDKERVRTMLYGDPAATKK